ncbi:D-alanine--D-alanine ligase [Paracoccaceae bacterium]|nr:D-alanine--D-alanine ligase [Paracoccaceae bacterium]
MTKIIKPKNITKIVVLHGGISEEKEVSNSTAESCIEALKRIEFDVEALNVDSANMEDLAEIIKVKNPDVIFNALHGGIGENGTIQGLFEILKIPYTHSGVLSSATAMDKFISKKIFKTSGLPVIEDQLLNAEVELNGILIKPPFVIKPNNGGSSVGIQFIRQKEQIEEMRTLYGNKDREYLLEKYIPGRELTVAVLNGTPLTVTDIVTDDWYDYDAKYRNGGSKHVIPANVPKDIFELCISYAVKAHQSLGCRGITRSDFRWNEEEGKEGLYILELNTQPGMTKTSLVPEQAKYVGLDLPNLCLDLIKDASFDK